MHHTHPPPINPQIKHKQRLRFIVNAAQTNAPFTFDQVLNCIVFASTTTAGFRLFDQVKIRAVELWAVAQPGTSAIPSQGPTTVQVVFSGNDQGAAGDARVWSDTSMGIEPAHVRAVPSKQSGASFWQLGGFTAFSLTCPVGTVVDVDVSFRNDDSAPVATQALVAAVAGEVYYRGLDGVAIATTQLVPQAQLTR
jgi:hypothetical protein